MMRHMRLRSLFLGCLIAAVLGPAGGCRRQPHGPAWEIARVGGGSVSYVPEGQSGAGYYVSFLESCITDRDLECLHVLTVREIVSLDLSGNLQGTKITDAGLERLKDLANLQELDLTATNVSDRGLRFLGALKELRSLNLWGTQVAGPGLENLQSLSNLKWLNINATKLSDGGLAHVTGLRQIASLGISDTAVSDRGLAYISGLTQLNGLSAGPMITDAGLHQLHSLKNLKTIVLKGPGITDDGVRALRQALPHAEVKWQRPEQESLPAIGPTQADAVKAIEKLGGSVVFDKAVFGAAGTSVYLWAPRGAGDGAIALLAPLDQIRELQLAGGWISNTGLQYVSQLTELRRLSLRGDTWRRDEKLRRPMAFGCGYPLNTRDTWVNDDGLGVLAGLKELRSLDLTSTYVTDSGLHSVSQLSRLRELGLRDGVVTDTGLKELQQLKDMHCLDLTHTLVTDDGLGELQAFVHLEKLWLGRTLVTDAGIKKLEGLKELRLLDLSHTAITDAAVKYLAKMTDLTELNLDSTLLTDAAITTLRQSLPKVKIHAEDIGDRAPRATDAELRDRFSPFP